MISKSQVKFISSLHQKKFRKEHGLFIAEGEKVCKELMESGWPVHSLFMTGEFRNEIYNGWNQKTRPEICSLKELEKISALSTPQQIIAIAEIPVHEFSAAVLNGTLTLMLDDIRDPGNLGTIIRIADWFGINHVICSESCADAYNPKTVQATMGSLFRVKIYYESLEDVLQKAAANKLPVFGTVLDGSDIYAAPLSSAGIILIGSESHGISEALLPHLTHKIFIPSFSKARVGKADSLNAAMAAAIVCSEFRRRNFSHA
jgi:RNA methyltransferase, TrmH family